MAKNLFDPDAIPKNIHAEVQATSQDLQEPSDVLERIDYLERRLDIALWERDGLRREAERLRRELDGAEPPEQRLHEVQFVAHAAAALMASPDFDTMDKGEAAERAVLCAKALWAEIAKEYGGEGEGQERNPTEVSGR